MRLRAGQLGPQDLFHVRGLDLDEVDLIVDDVDLQKVGPSLVQLHLVPGQEHNGLHICFTAKRKNPRSAKGGRDPLL